jgi:hypothetical protein
VYLTTGAAGFKLRVGEALNLVQLIENNKDAAKAATLGRGAFEILIFLLEW